VAPVAVFSARRGHILYRVSTAKANQMRKLLRPHAKSNDIDAQSLTRLAIFDPEHPKALELASVPEQASSAAG
jgi:hypothetical protein